MTARPPVCARRASANRDQPAARHRRRPQRLGDHRTLRGRPQLGGDAATASCPGRQDSAATVRARWDRTNLYLAVHVTDDVIVNDSCDVWRDDEIELAFYAVSTAIPPAATRTSTRSTPTAASPTLVVPNPPIEAVAVTVPGGWNVEVRIPATHLYGQYTQLAAGVTARLRRRPARRRRRRGLGQLSDLAGHQHDHRRGHFGTMVVSPAFPYRLRLPRPRLHPPRPRPHER